MKQEVAKAPENLPATATANFFEKYGRAAAGRTIIGSLLRFSKFGEYRAGQYDDQVKCGTRMVAYMNSLCSGFTRWRPAAPSKRSWVRSGGIRSAIARGAGLPR